MHSIALGPKSRLRVSSAEKKDAHEERRTCQHISVLARQPPNTQPMRMLTRKPARILARLWICTLGYLLVNMQGSKDVHILAVLSQKGGTGKSHTVRSLSVAGILDGRRAAIIDADPQATVVAWGKRRKHNAPRHNAAR